MENTKENEILENKNANLSEGKDEEKSVVQNKNLQNHIEKEKLQDKKPNAVKQFFMFVFFSLGAGIIELITFTLLSLINPNSNVMLVIAEVLSVVFSCTFNCLVNRKFTFKSDRNVYVGLIAYLILYGIMTPLGAWFIVALKNAGVNEFLAKAMKMLVNFGAEFCFDKFFLFRHAKKNK